MRYWSLCLFVVGVCIALADGCALETTQEPETAQVDQAPPDEHPSVGVTKQAVSYCPYRRANVQEFAMWVVGSPYTGDYTCYQSSASVWFCRSPHWPDYVRLYYPPQVGPSPSNPCPRLIADYIECSDAIAGCNGPTGRISCTGYTTNAFNECR